MASAAKHANRTTAAILARRPACGHAATINEHPNSSFNAVTVTGPIDKACATEAIDNTRLTANATRAMRSTHPVTRTATASANAANRAENHHGIGDTLTNNVRPFTSAATRGVVAPRMIAATPHPSVASCRSAGIAPNAIDIVLNCPPNVRASAAALHDRAERRRLQAPVGQPSAESEVVSRSA